MNSSSRSRSRRSIISPIGLGGSLALLMTRTGYCFVEGMSVRWRSELRRSFHPPLFVGFPESYKIIHIPDPICDASGHGRGHAKCTMNLDEIVGEIIEGRRRSPGCATSLALAVGESLPADLGTELGESRHGASPFVDGS